MSRLPGSRDGVEAPRESSGLRVEGVDVAAMSAVASGPAYDDFVFNDEWSAVDIAAAFLDVFDFDVPDFFAGIRVERDYVIVHRAEENQSIPDCDAAIEFAIGRYEVAGELVVVGP